jgi:hypothetical protein
MSRLLALISVAVLAGCTAAPQSSAQPIPQPAAHADTTGLVRKLQNHWSQCLEQSYRTTIKQTPDKNTAAEMAFQACSSEEQDLASYINTQIPYAPSPMPHLKAETKRVLIEEGHLPIYPEQ